MIHIITGYSDIGGSTIAFINLTNALNEAGIDCIFYGYHDWFLGKCRSELLTFTSSKLQISSDDSLIFHFKLLKQKPACKKVILSCHEQNIINLSSMNLKNYDAVHFVSKYQADYHNLDYPYFIIPNIVSDLKPNIKCVSKVAGIIGSVDRNKQTHVSIQRALNDGFQKILLFGKITDIKYWNESVSKLIDGDIVKYMGIYEDKQKMYDSISDVYLSSERECLPLVVAESQLTRTKLHGLSGKKYLEQDFIFDKKEIVSMWKKELGI